MKLAYSPLSNCRGGLINRGVGSPPDIGNLEGGGNKLKWMDIRLLEPNRLEDHSYVTNCKY